MSMSCLCRINISNAAMYIYELHLLYYIVTYSMRTTSWKRKIKTNSQWNKKINKKNRTAYFTINEDKLCTSSRMQFSLLYLPICESRWWSLFLWRLTQPSVRRFFSFIFSVWFYFCGSCKYIIPLNRLNPDFIRFHIEIWINSAAHKIHHLDLWIFGDTHKLQIKFKTHFQPYLNHMHGKNS